MAHKKQSFRFEDDWALERLETRTFQYVKEAITVPVNVEIEGEHLVLNLENVKQILGKAHKISVMDCHCRVDRGHCDAPVNVCMDMNARAALRLLLNCYEGGFRVFPGVLPVFGGLFRVFWVFFAWVDESFWS